MPVGHDQRTEPVWRLCDRPLETFARSPLPTIWYLTLAGRGGSVSRRDLDQLTGNHAQLAWARTSQRAVKSIPSRSSGEGVWGGGASLREAASSPESPSQKKKYQMKRWQVAAALSAAVTTTTHIGDAPTFRRNQLRRSPRPKRQLLFGRGPGGGDSLREAASPGVPPPSPLEVLYA